MTSVVQSNAFYKATTAVTVEFSAANATDFAGESDYDEEPTTLELGKSVRILHAFVTYQRELKVGLVIEAGNRHF